MRNCGWTAVSVGLNAAPFAEPRWAMTGKITTRARLARGVTSRAVMTAAVCSPQRTAQYRDSGVRSTDYIPARARPITTESHAQPKWRPRDAQALPITPAP